MATRTHQLVKYFGKWFIFCVFFNEIHKTKSKQQQKSLECFNRNQIISQNERWVAPMATVHRTAQVLLFIWFPFELWRLAQQTNNKLWLVIRFRYVFLPCLFHSAISIRSEENSKANLNQIHCAGDWALKIQFVVFLSFKFFFLFFFSLVSLFIARIWFCLQGSPRYANAIETNLNEKKKTLPVLDSDIRNELATNKQQKINK